MRFIGLILALFLSTLIGVTLAYAFGLTTSLDPDSFAAALARDTKLVEGMWCWRKICAEGTAFMEVPRLSRPELSWRIVNDIDATTRAWQSIMLTADVDTNIMIYGSRSQAQVTAFDVGRGYISVGELMLQYGKPLAAYTSPPTGKTKRTRVCFADFVCAYLYHRSSRLTLTSTVFVPRITFRP